MTDITTFDAGGLQPDAAWNALDRNVTYRKLRRYDQIVGGVATALGLGVCGISVAIILMWLLSDPLSITR